MRINWTNEWEKIIWSDESRFELFQNDSKSWVWRKVNEKYNVECLKPTVKNSIGIMVWGCFYKNQVGPIVLVEGTLNADKYIKLLKENLLPFLNELGIGEYIFKMIMLLVMLQIQQKFGKQIIQLIVFHGLPKVLI